MTTKQTPAPAAMPSVEEAARAVAERTQELAAIQADIAERDAELPTLAEKDGDAFEVAALAITARCALGKRDGMKSIRECHNGFELDLQTLIWTRGRGFPLSSLQTRLRCPRCGSREVRLLYNVPTEPSRLRSGIL